MNLNLNFVSKVPKIAKDSEIILLPQKVIKNKEIKKLSKSVFSNKLFSEQNFLAKDYNDKSYIFVNCTKSKISLDFEKLGSKLYVFLKENKKENSFINVENNDLFTNFSNLFLLFLSFNKIISLSLATFGILVTNSKFSFIFLKYLIDNVVYLLNL